MKGDIDQRRAGIVISYITILSRVIVNMLYTPFLLRIVGQNEYGVYQLSLATASYLNLLSFGFGSSYIKFYSEKKNEHDDDGIARLNGMFLCVFLILGIICLITGAFLLKNIEVILGNRITVSEYKQLKGLLFICVINIAITFPESVFNCYIIASEMFFFHRTIIAVCNIIIPAISIPFLLGGYGTLGVMAITLCVNVLAVLARYVYCIIGLGMKFIFYGFRVETIRSLGVFTFFIFLNQIIDQINWSVDKILLGSMVGVNSVAVYGIGAQLNTFLISLSVSISNVFVPDINRKVISNDVEGFNADFVKIGRLQFLVEGLMVSFLLLFGREFICVWAGAEYIDSYYVMAILISASFVPLLQNTGIEIQRAKNKHQVRSIVYLIMAIINIAISIPLIKLHNSIGAALGTFITMIIGNVTFMNYYYSRVIGINIRNFWREICSMLKGIIPAVLLGVGLRKVVVIDGVIELILVTVAYTLIYILCMCFWVLNSNEKRMIYKGWKR